MFELNSLPEKGEKRIKAILALGDNAENGEVLLHLANTEKGKYKTAAQKALAKLEYEPAGPLWRKLVKSKNMSEGIFSDSCSDCVSEQIAPAILTFLSNLIGKNSDMRMDVNQFEQLKLCLSIMLGKSSEKMRDVYRFMAEPENKARFASLQRLARHEGDDTQFWLLNNTLRIWNVTAKELEKVFPLVMTASIIKKQAEPLMELADELYAKHGGAWLIPVFMKAILTQPKAQVYDDFSRYLSQDDTAEYILNALGLLDYNDYPKGDEFRRDKAVGYYALFFWGNLKYGSYDTTFAFSTPVDIDERWLFELAKNSSTEKPKVAWQSYNRGYGGVHYESYDEMLLGLLPQEVNNDELRIILRDYFKTRSQHITVAESISVYRDALGRLG